MTRIACHVWFHAHDLSFRFSFVHHNRHQHGCLAGVIKTTN